MINLEQIATNLIEVTDYADDEEREFCQFWFESGGKDYACEWCHHDVLTALHQLGSIHYNDSDDLVNDDVSGSTWIHFNPEYISQELKLVEQLILDDASMVESALRRGEMVWNERKSTLEKFAIIQAWQQGVIVRNNDDMPTTFLSEVMSPTSNSLLTQFRTYYKTQSV